MKEKKCEDCSNYECERHVNCDEDCMALREPKTLEETMLAYRHWKSHSYCYGCSHGA